MLGQIRIYLDLSTQDSHQINISAIMFRIKIRKFHQN